MGLIFIIIILFTQLSHANVTTFNDVNYFKYDHQGYTYIFPTEHQKYLKKAIEHNASLTELYENSYNWQLDEQTSLVLVSSKNQTANAFATVIPNVLTVFYSGGPYLLSEMSTQSWLETLINHETAHLYQLNVKPPQSSALKSLFGTPYPFNFGAIFPYMIHPNIFAPSLMTEGNAVLQESLFKKGGRLFNGKNLAMVLALAKAGAIVKKRVINDHLMFPFGQEKYLVGGYFNAFLAEKYGIKQTNSYFKNQASHYLNPMRLEAAFKDTFGKSFSTLLNEFNTSLKDMAQYAKQSSSKKFTSSVFLNPLVEYNNDVYFINFNTGVNPPSLFKINKDTGDWTSRPTTLSNGKLFFIDKKPYVAKTSFVSVSEIKASLFDENNYDLESYRNKLLAAKDNSTEIAYDLLNSFDQPKLLKNDKPIEGSCHSQVLLDENSNYNCFRIDGDQIHFVKEGESLFTLKGNYGNPVKVTSDSIVFIATSQFGSGLFEWVDNKFYRLHPSDNIVDAKILNNKKILFAEVTFDGYDYKIDDIKRSEESPHTIEFSFPDATDYSHFKPNEITLNENNIKSYFAPFELKFNSFMPSITSSENLYYYNLPFAFSDPLGYNSLALDLGIEPDATDILLNYNFAKYSLQFGVLYYKNDSAVYDSNNQFMQNISNEILYLTTVWNIYKKGRHATNLSTQVGSEKSQDAFKKIDEYESVNATWNYIYNYQLSLGFDSHRKQLVSLGYKNKKNLKSEKHEPAAHLLYSGHWHIKNELYTTASVKAVTSLGDTAQASLDYNPLQLYSQSTSVTRMSPGVSRDYFDLGKFNLVFKKVIEGSNILTEWFPFGLRRYAILATGNIIYATLDKNRLQSATMTEHGWGINAEVLFLHQFPIEIQILFANNNLEEDQTDFSTQVSITSRF